MKGENKTELTGEAFRLLLSAVKEMDADSEDASRVLSELCRFCRKKAYASMLPDRDGFPLPTVFFRSAHPKARKNAARLAGILADVRCTEGLIRMLSEEETLYVIPSVLLALGNLNDGRAVRALQEYRMPVPASEQDQKHIREIRDALEKASGHADKTEPPEITKLPAPVGVLAVPPEGFADVLLDEMTAAGFTASTDGTVCVTETDDLAGLLALRCAAELLIQVGSDVALSPAEIAPHFSPYASWPYRIELRGFTGDRTKFIRALSESIGGENSPSSYSYEFRVSGKGDGADLFVKPCRVRDLRYPYRKNTVPASIHPATAACLVRCAKRMFEEGNGESAVLDPCCGSGTLLFEREAYGRCADLLGVDINGEAVRCARANADAAESRARFIQKDLIRFIPRRPVTELYANLPFGNRVGSHAENACLYAALIGRLPGWLSDNGFAVLYTMEQRMLEKLLKKESRLKVIEKRVTEAGGLHPGAFFLRKNNPA